LHAFIIGKGRAAAALAGAPSRDQPELDALNKYLPDSLLLAMATEIGDSIWLDPARPKPGGDCRVILMSHETGEELREWSSIAEFLEELLAAEAG
jgi:hypothetical protein